MRNQRLTATTPSERDQLDAYVARLRHLAHPNVVSIAHHTRSDTHTEVHLDIPCSPTLEDWLKTDPDVPSRLHVAACLASTLTFLAGRGYGIATLSSDAVLVREDHSVVLVDLFMASRTTAEAQTLQMLRGLLAPLSQSPDPLRIRARGEQAPVAFPDLTSATSLLEVADLLTAAVRQHTSPRRNEKHAHAKLAFLPFLRRHSTAPLRSPSTLVAYVALSVVLLASFSLLATNHQPPSTSPRTTHTDQMTDAPASMTPKEMGVSTPLAYEGERYEVRGSDTTPLVGDWNCNHNPFPVVFQASNQQLYAFPHWPTPQQSVTGVAFHTVSATATVSLVREENCDRLLVSDISGSRSLDVRALLHEAGALS